MTAFTAVCTLAARNPWRITNGMTDATTKNHAAFIWSTIVEGVESFFSRSGSSVVGSSRPP
jgi:hypothetical protein